MSGIKSIEISQFRGIKQLEVSGFSRINLIVGDNNSGKTTFLEAIQLLFAEATVSAIFFCNEKKPYWLHFSIHSLFLR